MSYQRQLGTDWAASANFLVSRGRHLPVSNETNPATFIPGTCGAGPCSTAANSNQRRKLFLENPTLGSAYADLIEIVNIGRSLYKGLLLSAQRRSVSGLSVQGNYTLSTCDSDRLEMAAGGTLGATPLTRPGDLQSDYGSCGGADRRHVVNLSTVYQTPRATGLLGVLASDWQVSGILQAQSGNHFSVVTGVDNALNKVAQTPTQRPNQILDDPYLKQGYRWLNPAAFQAPAPGTYGTMPINTIVAPGRFNIDAGLTRSFRTKGEQELQFRAEVFNLLNRSPARRAGAADEQRELRVDHDRGRPAHRAAGGEVPVLSGYRRRVSAVRRAREQHPSTLEDDLAGVGGLRAVLGQEALNRDGRAGRQILLAPSLPDQRAGNAKLQGPGNHLSIGFGHLDVEPGMGIHPRHLHDFARQRDALGGVEFRRKLVMRER